ncbi:hypothetical protein XENTR_v10023389 [Xenopus tropicalis]|nr:hypothetical protein XENTR_v10023389 [Xenopus tropicalis]
MAFPSGTRCWTTGWGDVEYGGYQPRPNTLQEVELQLFSDQQCKNAYFSEIQPDMICAGDSSGGKDSCQVDSGGLVDSSPNNESRSMIGLLKLRSMVGFVLLWS